MQSILNHDTARSAEAPIGVFDYGIGGLTVIESLARAMPGESFVFFADEAKKNYPEEEPLARKHRTEDALRYADFLCRHSVKMIVVACNLMSAFAIEALQKHVDVPVVGLVQPAIAELSRYLEEPEGKTIAVFTTEMAAYLKLFTEITQAAFPGVRTVEVGCGSLPGIVARDLAGTEEADNAVRLYTSQVPAAISAALLACTRFPVLKSSFEKQLPGVPVLDPAAAIPGIVKTVLQENSLLSPGPRKTSFMYTTGDVNVFQSAIARMLPGFDFDVGTATGL